MLDLVWLIPALPLAAFTLLVFFAGMVRRKGVTFLATLPVGISAVLSLLIAVQFIQQPPPSGSSLVRLWTWLQIGNFAPDLSFYVDPLSIVMILVICFVSFFINLYSTGVMAKDEGYARFFAYMNLFEGSMVILVLAENLLFLYLGWEAVGLCSYLLIGFWYKEPENGYAAIKAFVVTRVGDAALAIGLFVLFLAFGSLSIPYVMTQAQNIPAGSTVAVTASILVLIGAIGKSAQLPLQTWLPDAMAGPTPVSALIHAATMVTAGVYLIARTHTLFVMAPQVLSMVAAIGAITLVIAACSALVQRRIKRVLAYSTISQIGYMFLALGVGAWSAAIFHFMTHAFFKALLFLSAGAVIQTLNEEHDLFKMGGLRKGLPVVFWTFLIGACSLASLPLVTAGFYSKDLIIFDTLYSPRGGTLLWLAGIVGAFLTALYAFRMVFLVFFGTEKTKPRFTPPLQMRAPLIVFAAAALLVGFVQVPGFLGGSPFLGDFLSGSFGPHTRVVEGSRQQLLMTILTSVLALLGIALAYLVFVARPHLAATLVGSKSVRSVRSLWASGWGFDWLYDHFLVSPFLWLSRVNRGDVIDLPYRALAWTSGLSSEILALSQSGKVRWYAMGVAFGAIAITGMVIFL